MSGETIFISPNGRPLVYYTAEKGAKVDLIAKAWDALLEKCPTVHHLSFKYLRKTGSDMVRSLSDLETSQAFLAHSGQSVAERHYNNRDFARLNKAMLAMFKALEPMFNDGHATAAESASLQR